MLAEVEWLEIPMVPEECIHGYQAYVCLFRPEEPTLSNAERLHRQRNELMMRLEAKGIATRQGTHAPVVLSYYYNVCRLPLPSCTYCYFCVAQFDGSPVHAGVHARGAMPAMWVFTSTTAGFPAANA